MKKIIAVLIALAMVLSMSVMAFAEFNGKRSPADINADREEFDKAATWNDAQIGEISSLINMRKTIRDQGIYVKEDNSLMTWDEAWSAYYAYVLENVSSDPKTAVTEIVSSVTSGYVAPGDAISMVGNSVAGGIGGDGESGDFSGVISDIIDKITGGENKEPEVSTEAYVEELTQMINDGVAVNEITKKIGEDIASGKIVANQLPDIAKAISEKVDTGEIENNETVQKVLEFIKGLGSEGDGKFPSFSDITLPWDIGNSESGSFLDTILGIIGSIGNIFNPSTPDEPTPGPGPNEEPSTTDPIPDTGDVSFVAVAAVAAVAGAAFILTRKKNDAE